MGLPGLRGKDAGGGFIAFWLEKGEYGSRCKKEMDGEILRERRSRRVGKGKEYIAHPT